MNRARDCSPSSSSVRTDRTPHRHALDAGCSRSPGLTALRQAAMCEEPSRSPMSPTSGVREKAARSRCSPSCGASFRQRRGARTSGESSCSPQLRASRRSREDRSSCRACRWWASRSDAVGATRRPTGLNKRRAKPPSFTGSRVHTLHNRDSAKSTGTARRARVFRVRAQPLRSAPSAASHRRCPGDRHRCGPSMQRCRRCASRS